MCSTLRDRCGRPFVTIAMSRPIGYTIATTLEKKLQVLLYINTDQLFKDTAVTVDCLGHLSRC